MKIKCTADVCSVAHSFTVGKMYEIVKDEKGYKIINNQGVAWCNGRASEEIVLDELRRYYDFEVIPDRHELHITSDGVTTNAVYKLNGKVTKTAKAVCCPSDTFNFNTGAELAINRVLYGTDYNPKDVAIGKPVCTESAPKQNEPKQEAVTLYCVKDYHNWNDVKWLAKGNTYTAIENFLLSFDDGFLTAKYDSFEHFARVNPNIAACLIRAEKRPAKVGEWVLIVDAKPSISATQYKNGDILKITHFDMKFAQYERSIGGYVKDDEYLVLPDYVPEKVEPEYWSGKAVAISTDDSFVKGKVYLFKNGHVTDDDGDERPMCTPVESVNNLWFKFNFMEYRGEQC